MRRMIVAFLVVTVAAGARAELPVIAPASEQPVPAAPSAVPVPVRPLETAPVPATVPTIGATQSTVAVLSPWTVNCQPAAACADPCAPACEKRPGVLRGLKNWLCGTGTVEACPAPCPVSCPAPPPVRVVAVPVVKPCPMPVRPTVECPTCDVSAKPRLVARGGACCEKIKAWFCWKPCNEQLLPVFCPTPYHAPATAYLGACREPAAPLPCGTCKKPAKAAPCETGACPQPVGPVVAKVPPIIGWSPIYASYAPPSQTNIVPVGAILPVAKPQPVNPIARPFTSP